MRHRAGCEVCGDKASVTTAGMCLCAPCAGAPATATAGILGDAFVKTIDPFGLRHHLPTGTDDVADKLVKKPLGEITDTIKIVAIAGSVAVIAFVAYEIFKKPPRGVAA